MKKFMTNIKTLAALLITASAFIACSSDDNTTDEQPVNPTQKTYTLTIKASKGDNAASRITRALSLVDNNLTATWTAGDQVTVYNKTKGKDLGGYLEAQGNGGNTTLSGTLTGTIEEGDELTLKFRSPEYAYQEGTLGYIAANCDYAEATVTVASVDGGKITTNEDADFNNKQAIVKFTLQDKESGNGINAMSLDVYVNDVNYGTTHYIVEPKDITGEFYVALPGITAKKLVLTTSTLGGESGVIIYSFTRNSVTFYNGQYYDITVNMKQDIEVLSMGDAIIGNSEPQKTSPFFFKSGEKWEDAINKHYKNTIEGWAIDIDNKKIKCNVLTLYKVNEDLNPIAVRPDDLIDEGYGASYILQ